MRSSITSSIIPILTIELDSGESIIAETGELAWMSPQLRLSTSLRQGKNGISRILARTIGGSSAFLTRYSAPNEGGSVTFASRYPGRILPLQLTSDNSGYCVAKHSFICGSPDVSISIGFQKKIGVALYGKEGFILQKLSGHGTAWIELGGETYTHYLEEDQEIAVHPGHIGAFESSVQLRMKLMRGISNIAFGKDGLVLAYLRGPGHIALQSLPVPRLAKSLEPFLALTGTAAAAGTIGFFDAALETILPGTASAAKSKQ
ncbi:MAG: AIM24 family protein [Candidatus Dormibacteria bacterium]